MSLNKVLLIGNAGKDPEVRHLEGGVATASFSLATTERFRDRNSGEYRDQTEWHNIVCWRNQAEFAERYIRKGTQLFIEGRIRTRSYSDRDGNMRYTTEIVVDNIQLLGRKSDNPAANPGAPAGNGYQAYPAAAPTAPQYQAAAQQRPQPQPSPKEFVPQVGNVSPEEDVIGDDLPF